MEGSSSHYLLSVHLLYLKICLEMYSIKMRNVLANIVTELLGLADLVVNPSVPT